MEIKSLEGIAFDRLADAFMDAFADYDIVIDRPQLQAMLTRRGFNPELSFAAFDNGRIVSFTFNGTGVFDGQPTAYDTGTGTVARYRGQGLAGRIFEYATPRLVQAGISRYILEVLQNNHAAINVYGKMGFVETRQFNCYFQECARITPRKEEAVELRRITIDRLPAAGMFHDFAPSWQNSHESIIRAGDTLIATGAFINGRLAGYSVVEPASGDLTQIAVDPGLRRRGIGCALLSRAAGDSRTGSLKAINIVPSCHSLNSFLLSAGMEVRNTQFEMELKF